MKSLYGRLRVHLDFLWPPAHLMSETNGNDRAGCAMLFDPKHEVSLERLAHAVRLAPTPTPDLLSQLTRGACPRLPLLRTAGKAAQLDRLIEAGAWTDAAIALIGVELPGWQVRRLVYE